MSFTPALLALLEKTLAPTSYCFVDMLNHGMGDWHAAVLLDNAEHLSSLAPQALNNRDFAGHSPLDIAYRLNRTALIERLEALGALGDKTILTSRGVGRFIENDKYVHLPAKQGKIKTLEKRYLEGAGLNDRDALGNTPLHWLAANGHFKAAKHFSENHFRYGIDIDAKNSDGNTARNLATIAKHHDIVDQLLSWEIDNYITAARIRHKVTAGLQHMLPKHKSA